MNKNDKQFGEYNKQAHKTDKQSYKNDKSVQQTEGQMHETNKQGHADGDQLAKAQKTISFLLWSVGVAYVLIIALFGYVFTNQSPVENSNDFADNVFEIRKNDIVYGNPKSDIVVFEYSDIECPFCKRFHTTLNSFIEKNDVAWVYRHLPIPEIGHITAEKGAILIECLKNNESKESAKLFLNLIFEAFSKPSLEYYKSVALSLSGLTNEELNKCLASDSEESKYVAKSKKEAGILGLRGTPSGALVNIKTNNRVQIPGAISENDLEQLLDVVTQ